MGVAAAAGMRHEAGNEYIFCVKLCESYSASSHCTTYTYMQSHYLGKDETPETLATGLNQTLHLLGHCLAYNHDQKYTIATIIISNYQERQQLETELVTKSGKLSAA